MLRFKRLTLWFTALACVAACAATAQNVPLVYRGQVYPAPPAFLARLYALTQPTEEVA